MSNINAETEAGIRKKSFELFFNGGSIWCEHLDGMGNCKEKVIEKFLGDYPVFSRPSMTSFMIINLDETVIDSDIISCIKDKLINSPKRYMKIAFVGVKGITERWAFRDIGRKIGCPITFLNDFEKAKQWVLPE